ncbi:hypothetical protein PDR51_29670, partial [Bacillus cereus]|nr:hypothetical protein [Bacillus cereus]
GQKKTIVEKVYELKVEGKNDLIDKKSMYLSEYADAVEDIMNAAYEQQEGEFGRLDEKIKQLIPVWKEEIQAEYDKKIQERQLKLEEDKNNREREELALRNREQQAQEMKTNEKIRELQNLVEDLNDKLIKSYAGTGQLPPQSMYMYQPVQPVPQPVYMYQQQPVPQPAQQPVQPQPMQQPVQQPQSESSPHRRRKLFEHWYKQ